MSDCKHEAYVQKDDDGQTVVRMANDDDGNYVETFDSRAALETFIDQLRSKADEAWPLCELTKLDINAEVGKPFEARAVFEGDGVKMFAAHMAEWFREHSGENFITIDMSDPTDGTRFELTMRRATGKSPAQLLSELRAELNALRGTPEQPFPDLIKRLPNVEPALVDELLKESQAELIRRVLIQKDWLGAHARCLDGMPARIGGSGVDACRMPREVRTIVEHLRALLKEIYDADAEASARLATLGLSSDPKYAHRIEDALGLPSTRPRS